MKRKTRFLSFFLAFLMLMSLLPISALTAFASEKVDEMTAIENAHSDKRLGDVTALTTDGYIGIPIKMSVYYDESKGKASPSYEIDSTPVIVYVVNTMATRTGTDSDADIIADMLSKGYIVLVVDYQNSEKAISPDLDWSVQGLLADIRDGKYFPTGNANIPSGKYYNTIVVPAGHNVTFNEVFFEMDKHAAAGTLDYIVNMWNNDFRGCEGETVIKWVHADGTKKATQNGFDGTSPVWYSDAAGTTADANGQYIKIKHTLAQTITDCVKQDGSPIDLNLYMHIVYPTNPVTEVPVMTLHCSSEHLASGLRTADRPHVNGFLFEGYAISTYDYAYVPMARNDHYGYFDGATMPGSVTGDQSAYSVYFYSMQEISTAAIRYVRYLTLSEPETYKFNTNAIGIVGNSKGSLINFLGAPEYQEDQNKKIGDAGIADQAALESYVENKIVSAWTLFDFAGHSGETRYTNGDTESYTVDGFTIDGGEMQPWLTYNGKEIASGVNFIYENCGSTHFTLRDGYAPHFFSVHVNDSSGYTDINTLVNLARNLDIPAVYLEAPYGHTFVGREDVNYGVNPYNAYKDFANFILNGKAVKLICSVPTNDSVNVDTTASITLKFTGMVDATEIEKVTVIGTAGAIDGTWSSAFGGTEWTFTPATALDSATKYTVTVPAGFKGTNGTATTENYTSSITTKAEAIIPTTGGVATVTDTNGTYVTFTAPNMADYSAINANKFNLRIKVATEDAANTVNVYAVSSTSDTSTANLVGKAYLKGDGYYDIDVTDYMSGISEDTAVYFFVKAEKAASTAQTFKEDFTGKHSFATGTAVTQEVTTAPDGTSALKVTLNMHEGTNGFDYWRNESRAVWNNTLLKNDYLTDADYGRRFTIKIRVYDTISREISAVVSTRSNQSKTIRDYQTSICNFTTKANTWQTFELECVVYDMDYGTVAYDIKKSFYMNIASDGENPSPIYFDYFEVIETVTDVNITESALVLTNEGAHTYKAQENANPFDVNRTKYADFASAYAAYASGNTIKLLKNYTLTAADIKSLAAFDDVIIDLNGYKLTGAAFLLKAENTAPVNVTVKNGTVLVGDSSLISYDGSTASGSGKVFNVTFENVCIALAENSKATQIISKNTTTDGVNITSNITLKNCTLDIDQAKHALVDYTVFAGTTNAVTLNYNMVGGNIKLSSLSRTELNERFNSLTLNKEAEGEYPTLILPNNVTLEENAYLCGNSISSFALPAEGYGENGYTEYTLTAIENATKYGVIPEKYADAQAYPFVVFDANGNAIGGYSTLLSGAFGSLHEKTASYTIVMRRDYTLSSTWSYSNLAFIKGNITLDLMDFTLDTNGYPLFLAVGKKNGTANISVINGDIAHKSTALILYESPASYDYETNGIKTFNFTFDNVRFYITEGATPSRLFTNTRNSDTNKVNIPLNTNVILNNCIIDLSNLTAATKLFDVGSTNGLLNGNYAVNGGNIIAPSLANVTVYSQLGENATMLFDDSVTLTLPSGAAIAANAIPTADGDKYFSNKISDNGTNAVYALSADDGQLKPVVTPYGTIPADAEPASTHPFAIFSGGTYKGVYKAWDTETDSVAAYLNGIVYNGNRTVDVAIVLRTDYNTGVETVKWNYVLGIPQGSIVIDLNGNTLTAGSSRAFLDIRAKSNLGASTLNIEVKNGTVELASKEFVYFGADSTSLFDGLKTLNITFSDLTMKMTKQRSTASPILFNVIASDSTQTLNSNITLNNCTLDFTANTDAVVIPFKLADSGDKYTANVVINGGKIVGVNKWAFDPLYTMNSGDTFKFGKYNGEYTELYVQNGTAFTDTFASVEDGEVKFLATDTENVYKVGIAAQPIVTPYGEIPAQYADAEKYPFAVFKDGAFYGCYAHWADNNTSEVTTLDAVYSILSTSNNVVILLRRDYTTTTTSQLDVFYNLGKATGNITLDLGENSITTEKNAALFFIEAKSQVKSGTLNITVKNGTVLVKNAPIVQIQSYSTYTGLNTLNVEFTDLTIRLAKQASSSLKGMIAYVNGANTARVQTSITLNNCTVDLKTNAPASALTVFAMTDTNGYVTNVSINGGKIFVADMSKVTLHTGNEDEDTFVSTAQLLADGGNIQNALNGMVSGSTLTLNGDMSGGSITVDGAATIDLNGKVLTVDGLAAFDKLTIIDSGVGTKGLIKTAKGSITLYEIKVTGGILVYNAERGGYEVASVTDQSQYNTQAATKGFELIFRPSFDSSTAYNKTILGAGGAAADIKILVNLEDADGNLIKGFEFDDSLVQKAYSEKLALKLTVRNIPSTYEVINVKYIISSGTGQQCIIDAGQYTPAS